MFNVSDSFASFEDRDSFVLHKYVTQGHYMRGNNLRPEGWGRSGRPLIRFGQSEIKNVVDSTSLQSSKTLQEIKKDFILNKEGRETKRSLGKKRKRGSY